jgi:plastocyanin
MHMRTLARSALPVLLIAGCAKTEPPAEQVDAAPAAPAMVHVTATDYAFQAPDTLPSGVTTFHLMNEGKEAHHVVLIKMPLAQLQQADMSGPPPADLVVLGGPNAAMPGGTAEATVDLAPGTYTLVCFIPAADGRPHIAMGMARELTVTQGTSTAAMPVADITIKLTDYAFELSAPLTAGRHTIRVDDAGPQMHELVFVKLEPGKTVQDMAAWLEKPQGPPPGSLINGASPMTAGMTNTTTVDLTPGEYGMICFVPDAKDKKPHLVHGMIKQFTVN